MRRNLWLYGLAALVLLAACGGQQRPTIASFTADPLSLPPGGGEVLLAWNVQGATSLSVAPNVGTVTGSSQLLSVTATTTYVLTATGAGGSATASVTVTVADGTDTQAPTISSVFPPEGGAGVRGNVQLLVEFNEAMDRAAAEAAYASASAGLEPANVTFGWNAESTILTVTPAAALAYAAGEDPAATPALAYTYTIGAGATDVSGNAMSARSFTFTTLRHITATLPGDPQQDGSVAGGVVNNDILDLSVGGGSTGFLGFGLGALPAALNPSNVLAARLLANGEFPCTVGTNEVSVEHVAYGATLTSAATTTTALRSLGYMAAVPDPEPDNLCWNQASAAAAVADDVTNRTARGDRSQYRLNCVGCTQIFFAAEAAESGGDAQTKWPRLEVEYLVE